MKKIIAVVMLSFGFSLMAFAQTNISGCTVINGVQVCANTGGGVAGGQVITNGATGAVGASLMNLIVSAQGIVNLLVPFGIGLAVVALFYGIVKFIFIGKGDTATHAASLHFIGMALIGLFVMVSIWGLINFMGSVLGIGQGGGIPVPALPVTPKVY